MTQDDRFSQSNEEAKRLSQSIQGSMDKSDQYREEASRHVQQSQSYSESANWAKQNAVSINENLNQEYLEWVAKQPGGPGLGSMGVDAASSIIANNPHLNRTFQQSFMTEKLKSMENYIEQGHKVHSVKDVKNAFDDDHIKHADHPYKNDVLQKAQKEGMGDHFKVDQSSRVRV